MGNSLISKIIYFWVFMIGGLFIARLIGLFSTSKDAIIILIVLACVYWGLALVRAAGKKRRGR